MFDGIRGYASEVREFRGDRHAVSPVIGIVLMVGVTVILAAVIATYAFGFSVGEQPPAASFSYEHESGVLHVTHDGGSVIEASNLFARGDLGTDATADLYQGQTDLGGSSSYTQSEVAAGNSFTISTAGSKAEVRIVYDDGQRSTILDRYEQSGT